MVSDGTRHLTLFGSEKFDAIYDRIRQLLNLKSGITYICSNFLVKIKVDSYNYLPMQKTLTLHNVIMLIK